MSTLAQTLWWIALVIGLIGAAAFAALETAVYCLNRVRLRVRATDPHADAASRILFAETSNPERLLAVQLIAFTIFGDMAATSATALMSGYGYSPGDVILLNILILTPVFFILLESVPKEIGRLDPDRVARAGAWATRLTRWILTGLLLLPLTRGVTKLLGRFIGGDGEAALTQLSRERLAALIRESAEGGGLSLAQAGLFERALAFGRVGIDDEMVPWSGSIVLRLDSDRRRVADVVARSPHMIYPVCDDRGRVVGAVRLAELCQRPQAPLEALLVPVLHLPVTVSAHEALLTLRRSQCRLGIVESDGRPVGLVTLEDLLEPLTSPRRRLR